MIPPVELFQIGHSRESPGSRRLGKPAPHREDVLPVRAELQLIVWREVGLTAAGVTSRPRAVQGLPSQPAASGYLYIPIWDFLVMF